MIYVALALIGFGVADLVRWSPNTVGLGRAGFATAGGAAAVVVVAALAGIDAAGVALAGALALLVLWLWSAYDLLGSAWARPEGGAVLVPLVLAVLIGFSGRADPVGGELAAWYDGLGFGFAGDVPADQFVLAVGAAVFLLATANRVVRFVLIATESSLLKGEGTLRGGRVLGPMERLVVAAALLSGGVGAAGFVIAAKGLLRFREIRGDAGPGVDEITEYFLIGTLASLLVAGAATLLVLAGG